MGDLFKDKVAVVTGAATGIGRAGAVGFAAEGASVIVADINEEEGAETVRLITEAGGQARFLRTDVTKGSDVQAMVQLALSAYGRLDAAFNNAGTPGGFTTAVDCTEEEWEKVGDLNLKSVWLCMKYEVPAMLAGGRGGAIVNTASYAGLRPQLTMVTYDTTKAGVIGLTRSVARDFAPQNIRANTLLPGATHTPMLERGAKGLGRDLASWSGGAPMGRLGRSEEQAAAAIWLCSDQASYITGVSLPVDGGLNLL